jgi:sugar phosphate isomerase/epimerase
MNRREFLTGAAVAGTVAAAGLAGCKNMSIGRSRSRFLFGACRPLSEAKLLKSVGFDFIEPSVGEAFIPEAGADQWKKQLEVIKALELPILSCNCFLPGKFRLTGSKADHEPALAYAETVLRRADEAGVKTIVFGSGGARTVPGDLMSTVAPPPDVLGGYEQFTDFCAKLCGRVADLKRVTVVIEPLRANETNIVNFVWQGLQISRRVNSPRLKVLADIYHMMAGGEGPESLVQAGDSLLHCHVAECKTRSFPGNNPNQIAKLKPYFDALRNIGYCGGISCECGWGASPADFGRNYETALAAIKSL